LIIKLVENKRDLKILHSPPLFEIIKWVELKLFFSSFLLLFCPSINPNASPIQFLTTFERGKFVLRSPLKKIQAFHVEKCTPQSVCLDLIEHLKIWPFVEI